MNPTMSTVPFRHGQSRGPKDPDDLDNPPAQPSFEGQFGRMLFKKGQIPAEKPHPREITKREEVSEAQRLNRISDLVSESPTPNGRENVIGSPEPEHVNGIFEIPAGYAYLGQFVAHDLTLDPATIGQRNNDQLAREDYRTPRFDLDSLYGRGPADQPYLYQPDRVRMRLGEPIGTPLPDGTPPTDYDLPRINAEIGEPWLAIIGDARNDENVILSQLTAIFLRFHNRIAETLDREPDGASGESAFDTAQRYVRWYYQWVILFDFLPRIINRETYKSYLPNVDFGKNPLRVTPDVEGIVKNPPELAFYPRKDREAYMPVEFSGAAFRFGHSMIADQYWLNGNADNGIGGPFPILPGAPSDGHSRPDIGTSLFGRRRFRRDWAIDWRFFFEMGDSDQPAASAPGTNGSTGERLTPQIARPIRPTLADRLRFIPDSTTNSNSPLGLRDLKRGSDLDLPSGQEVAEYMGVCQRETIERLKELDKAVPNFSKDTPLWYYILAEAEGKGQLGAVGGRIVMETILGAMMADETSLLRSWLDSPEKEKWAPRDEWMINGTFGMAELIHEARHWKKAARVRAAGGVSP
jgi:hypothetical protein